ncbi:MAG TPA: hypothetical protein VE641_10795, partial [Chthoniobacterales bacterium]|nr:hypothetical protein [Chthoniobacterales bacterium]
METQPGKKNKRVSICETQPLTVTGLAHLLDSTDDLAVVSSHSSPAEWMMSAHAEQTDILIMD